MVLGWRRRSPPQLQCPCIMPTVKIDHPLRVVLAGFGDFGQVHAGAWRRYGSAVLLTIAEPDATRRQRAATSHADAEIVADPLPALAQADAIDIVTPADTHAELAIAALAAGCDVLVEKPFVLTAADAHRVATAAAKSDRLIQLGYFFRAHPLAQALRARLRAAEPAIWIDADFTSLKRPRRDAGVIDNDAVHFLDLVCWLVGRYPSEVTALIRHPLGRSFEDIALITLAWDDGLVARVQASCVLAGPLPDLVVPGGWSRKAITVTTRREQFTADFMTDTLRERAARLESAADGSWRTAVDTAQERSVAAAGTEEVVAAEIGAFLSAIRSRGPTLADLESGVRMVEICDAVHRSARAGRTVRLGS